jgi:hypothetical protein
VFGLSLLPHRLLGWWVATGGSVRALLRLVSHHTGLPVVLVAAVVVVASLRVIRRGVRFAFEVALALALLVAATHLGWIRW